MFRSLFSRFGKQRRSLSRCACLTRSFANVEPLEERTLLSVSTAIYSDLYEPGLFSGDAESQVAHIDFTFGDTPVIEDEGQGASVLWDGVDTWEVEGDPLVPYSSLTVLLPQGMDITSVTVSYGDAGEVLDTGVALQAAPTPMPISEWEEPEEYELVTTDFPAQDPVMFSSGSMTFNYPQILYSIRILGECQSDGRGRARGPYYPAVDPDDAPDSRLALQQP